MDENELYTLMCRLGTEKRIRQLSLRFTYLYEQYNMWLIFLLFLLCFSDHLTFCVARFGAQALRSLSHWSALEDLQLWACHLPVDFAQLLESTKMGARLHRFANERFSVLSRYLVLLQFT